MQYKERTKKLTNLEVSRVELIVEQMLTRIFTTKICLLSNSNKSNEALTNFSVYLSKFLIEFLDINQNLKFEQKKKFVMCI